MAVSKVAIMTPALAKFLGVPRWQALFHAWKLAGVAPFAPGRAALLLALSATFALIPVFALVAAHFSDAIPANLPTLLFGACTLAALLLRRHVVPSPLLTRFSLPELSLTHTAVAFGCIPAVALIILDPSLLANRQDVLTETIVRSGPGSKDTVHPLLMVGSALFIAAWVSVTEEVLFRGVLLSALRRVPLFSSRIVRDAGAIVLTALVFGFAHVLEWGWVAGVALFGLGCGFGIAYVVTNEKLAPVIGYHFLFDLLSIALVLLL